MKEVTGVNYKDLMSAIKLMAQGMSTIFIVMIAISAIVYLLSSISEKRDIL